MESSWVDETFSNDIYSSVSADNWIKQPISLHVLHWLIHVSIRKSCTGSHSKNVFPIQKIKSLCTQVRHPSIFPVKHIIELKQTVWHNFRSFVIISGKFRSNIFAIPINIQCYMPSRRRNLPISFQVIISEKFISKLTWLKRMGSVHFLYRKIDNIGMKLAKMSILPSRQFFTFPSFSFENY